MTNPKIAAKQPIGLELAPGNYYWCACGKSKNQPFCDGSHAGSDFTPVPFKIEEKKTYFLCQCKHSKNKPFCDGSHRTL